MNAAPLALPLSNIYPPPPSLPPLAQAQPEGMQHLATPPRQALYCRLTGDASPCHFQVKMKLHHCQPLKLMMISFLASCTKAGSCSMLTDCALLQLVNGWMMRMIIDMGVVHMQGYVAPDKDPWRFW